MPVRNSLFLLGMCLMLLLGGCAMPNDVEPEALAVGIVQGLPLPSVSPLPLPMYKDYTLLVRKADYAPARWEPAEGCYLGAEVLGDKSIGGRMDAFERRTNTAHAIYACEMTLGGEYPALWVLECIANGKTPCVIVRPANAHAPFDLDLLEQTARDVGTYGVPLFVQLLPYSTARYDRAGYAAFYAAARQVFAEHAPNAAIVWNVEDGMEGAAAFYPGDACVDWVGVVLKEGASDAAALAAFVQTYQQQKPIMVTLAVSHFSTKNNTYDIENAAAHLARMYAEIANRYPRVKAVLYRNGSEVDRAAQEEGVWHD